MWYQDRYLPMGAAVRELRKVVVSYTLRYFCYITYTVNEYRSTG